MGVVVAKLGRVEIFDEDEHRSGSQRRVRRAGGHAQPKAERSRERRPASGGWTCSPRSSASLRRSSSSSFDNLTGVSTKTRARRSPRRPPRRRGTPWPATLRIRPVWTPAGDRQEVRTVEGVELDLGAERRLCHRQVEGRDQISAGPLETAVALDAEMDVQIPGHPSSYGCRRPRRRCAGWRRRRPPKVSRR